MKQTLETVNQLDEFMTRPSDAVVEAVSQCPRGFAVLGAGGKMGFHVSRMLQRALETLGRTDPIHVVSRFSSPSAREKFERLGFHVIAADMSDATQVDSLPRVDNVVYLAGVKFGTASDNDILQRMNVDMPRLIAEHYSAANVVALSSGCVYSFSSAESGGSTEMSETDPPGEYAKSCLGRERAFIDASTRHGTKVALVRLNYSVDLRYGVLVDIAQNVIATRPVDVTMGHVNLIWQGDAVATILRCLPQVASPPFIINVTGSETLSVRDLAHRFAKRLDRSVKFSGQESSTAWLSDNSLATKTFGEPSVNIDNMIAWTADWLGHGGETLGKPTHFQNRDGEYG